MKKKTMITILLLTFLYSFSAVSAEKIPSQSGPMGKPTGFHLSLGVGVAMKNNIRRNNTYNNTHGDLLFSPIPLLQFGWGPLSFGGQGLKADLYGNRQWGVYTNIDRERQRYRGPGMDDRRDSWFWGIGGRYGKFSAHFARDIQGRSHGKKLNLNYAEMYMIRQKFFTRSSLGIECFDKNYADYYYGVKSTEINSGRNEYHPSRFCQPGVAFAPMYKMDEHVTFISAVTAKLLASEIRHSPTTKGGNVETGLIFGGLYQF